MADSRATGPNLGGFIWGVADLLRGPFKQSEYGRIILPFTVLRRLESVLEPRREAVLEKLDELQGQGIDLDLVLPRVANAPFYNTSRYSLGTLGQTNTLANLEDYVSKFSSNAHGIFEHFNLGSWAEKLASADLLHLVAQKFKDLDLHPNAVSNVEMGHIFEHLIYKFAESANETAGEFYTPRDIVRLATTLVITPDSEALTGEGVIRTVYDPAAGTGGFLSAAIEQITEWNPSARLVPYAQEVNAETYAIQVADKLIQGYDTRNLKLGNTLSDDQLANETFHYGLSNPPFGVDWKGVRTAVEAEHRRGFAGRFGPGLPRVSDGSMLFLMHLLSKRRPRADGGSRFGIVLSGSPLFTGGAGSGESEIRRWILENDYLEAIVALPGDMFYNTGIATYIWILSNAKASERTGKVQLIDATGVHTSMRKSLGNKRKFLSDEQIAEVAKQHEAFEETPTSKIFATTDFAYRRITIEHPKRLAFQITTERVKAMERVRFPKTGLRNPSQIGLEALTKRIVLHLTQALLGEEAPRFDNLDDFDAYVRTLLGTNPWERIARWPDDQIAFFVQGFEPALKDATAAELDTMVRIIKDGAIPEGPGGFSWTGLSVANHLLEFFETPLELAPNEHRWLLMHFSEPDDGAQPLVKKRHPDGRIEYEVDVSLRDFENVPWGEDVNAYFEREVKPFVPDAWIDEEKRDPKDGEVGIVGYEIPFNRHFYVYTPPRPLEEIDADLRETTRKIMSMIEGLY